MEGYVGDLPASPQEVPPMRALSVLRNIVLCTSTLALAACSSADSDGAATGSAVVANPEATGPGADATDTRVPELGGDPTIVQQAKVSMADGFAKARASGGIIEAKYEIGDDGKLSLSVYPAGKGLAVDAEQNVFQELSGDPTATPFAGSLEAFADTDREHLVRSTRDLTLVQLSKVSLEDAVTQASKNGTVFWAIPTIKTGRAGYGIYTLVSGRPHYEFIDGGGSTSSTVANLTDLGATPGDKGSDARAPELGADVTVVTTSKIKMSDALKTAEDKYGPTIEAKFEIGDDGKLSLSVYPIAKGLDIDAERNGFRELAGDPTAATWTPALEEFTAEDKEHQVRSARDLTIVQTASISLRDAVAAAEKALPEGIVYWAIPTIRENRSGFGIYILGADRKAHYFFVS
jgi:hypothetical protein